MAGGKPYSQGHQGLTFSSLHEPEVPSIRPHKDKAGELPKGILAAASIEAGSYRPGVGDQASHQEEFDPWQAIIRQDLTPQQDDQQQDHRPKYSSREVPLLKAALEGETPAGSEGLIVEAQGALGRLGPKGPDNQSWQVSG